MVKGMWLCPYCDSNVENPRRWDRFTKACERGHPLKDGILSEEFNLGAILSLATTDSKVRPLLKGFVVGCVVALCLGLILTIAASLYVENRSTAIQDGRQYQDAVVLGSRTDREAINQKVRELNAHVTVFTGIATILGYTLLVWLAIRAKDGRTAQEGIS
jgi:hypothetical protein